MIGSAALALAQVALGSADAYFEESICLWDIAAGAALVKSVGGYVEAKPVGDPKGMKYNVWAIAHKNWLKVLKN